MAEAHGPTYTLAKMAVAFKVRPAGTPALPGAPGPLPAGMTDPVLDWLEGHDMALSDGPNGRGFWDVICPWSSEHSQETKGSTGYAPGLPSTFHCLHGHCAGRGLAALKAWILEQDPQAEIGVLDGIDHEAIGQAIADDIESVRSSRDDGEQRTGGVHFPPPPMLPNQGEIRDEMIANYIHVEVQNKYWSVASKDLVERASVDDRMTARLKRTTLLHTFNDAGKRLKDMAVHIWLRQQTDLRRVANITHRLGQPLIVDNCVNIAPALPARITATGDPELWLDLVDFICVTDEDADQVLDWMAMVVTAFDEKPGWHLLIKGPPGVGKDLMLSPLVNYLAPSHWYGLTVKDIEKEFTPFLARRLVMLDELKMTTHGTISTHDIYNTIKAWTARGTKWVMINEKNRRPYEALDLSCWAPTSNAEVPLPLEEGDRRWNVIETPRVLKPKAYYQRLVKWLEHQNGHAIVIGYLQRRWDAMSEERRENVRGTAPVSAAKRELILNSAEGIDGAVRLAIAGSYGETWPDLMTVQDVMQNLRGSDLLSEQARRSLTLKRAAMALKAAGAVRLFDGEQIEDRAVRRRIRLWCLRPEMAKGYEKLGQGKELIDVYDAMRSGGSGPNVVKLNIKGLMPSDK